MIQIIFFFLSEIWQFVHFQGICPLFKLLNLLVNLMQSMQKNGVGGGVIDNKDNNRNQWSGHKNIEEKSVKLKFAP